MMSSLSVTWAVTRRTLLLVARLPSTIVPSLVMPIILTIAFAGAFSGLVLLPGHPADKAIDWFLPLYTIQGAAFSGVRVGIAVARDLSTGFYDRLLLSPTRRAALLAGSLLASPLLSVMSFVVLVVIAVIGGASFKAGPTGIVMLAVASFSMAVTAGAWSVGLALRFKTQQIAPLMQTTVFLASFLSSAQMPLNLLTGWLHEVAAINPITNVFALARQGFLGDVSWAATWPGLVSLTGLMAFFCLFAYRSMQKVIP